MAAAKDDSDSEFDGIRIEGESAVREIGFAVDFVELSTKLPSTDDRVYINLKTKENDTFCVELCLQGFRIVGKTFDTIVDGEMSRYYETIYSLLDNVSPEYRFSFGEALKKRLADLQDSRQQDDESWNLDATSSRRLFSCAPDSSMPKIEKFFRFGEV